jgi:hypothetical protein
MDDDWSHATANVRHANNIHMSLTGASNTTYFADAQTVVDITQPILDAIHTIEADKPLLSQMLQCTLELRPTSRKCTTAALLP